MITEILISLVEIIWMFDPRLRQRLEERRRHAGVRAHPNAHHRELADSILAPYSCARQSWPPAPR